MLHYRQTTLERAFDLARSGNCDNLTGLIDRLRAEGHDLAQLNGPTLLKQLKRTIKGAREAWERSCRLARPDA